MLRITSISSAALTAVWLFSCPQAFAQAPADGPGIVVEPGGQLLHRSPVFFPSGVTTVGTVVVESSINAAGDVTDTHVVSGPAELRRVVLTSVLEWRFSTGLPRTVQSTIRFVTAPSPTPEVGISCLDGVWRQDQPSDYRWRFQAVESGLSISRTDGFVAGTFTRTGTLWTGQLRWGNGETWNNVVLSPSGNCNEVRTNQNWWFKR